MKYLLSTGAITTDPVIYLRDLVKMNIVIPLGAIPYKNVGLDHNIGSINSSDIQSEVYDHVSDMVKRINVPTNCTLELKEVHFEGSTVVVDILINGESLIYEIAS